MNKEQLTPEQAVFFEELTCSPGRLREILTEYNANPRRIKTVVELNSHIARCVCIMKTQQTELKHYEQLMAEEMEQIARELV